MFSGNPSFTGTPTGISVTQFTIPTGNTGRFQSGASLICDSGSTVSINAPVNQLITAAPFFVSSQLNAGNFSGKVSYTTYQASGGFGTEMRLGCANGTAASPTAIGNTQQIGSVIGTGYDGSVYFDGAGMNINANQAWTGSAHGTSITFFTTPQNSSTAVNTLSLSSSVGTGNVNVPGNFSIRDTFTLASGATDFLSYATQSHFIVTGKQIGRAHV